MVIENVLPEIDGGRFPITRTPGELVTVSADIFADGHDVVDAALQHRREGDTDWHYEAMQPVSNDRWQGEFRPSSTGIYFYTLRGWVDRFKTWARDLGKKAGAGQDLSLDLMTAAQFLAAASKRAKSADGRILSALSERLRKITGADAAAAVAFSEDEDLISLMAQYRDDAGDTIYDKQLVVRVDRARARFSTWYEMFPRSCTNSVERPGTLRDCAEYVEYVADMGFDVLYLPPIHPIGVTERKGRNNSTTPTARDPGSPWAIGSQHGGHKAIHPELGTLADLRALREKAALHGIELALDIAFQCSPDHPYVREHREWFRSRADGTVQYAENPPKKYQDIYPFDFESEKWFDLWEELKSVFTFWIGHGVRIFRVDNPHTKPFPFWEWVITEIKSEWPDVLFLSEAFTRPKIMYRLGKLGFSQSYTYFPWRNTKYELISYITELTKTNVRNFFRPNHWPNTPDILTEFLHGGSRPAFMIRLLLAATLGANYGIYGPAFELLEGRPRQPGSEEYLDSEKYQVRHWDLNQTNSLRELITLVNRIRHENEALQNDWSIEFHPVDNDQLLCFSKRSPDGANIVVVVVNLDPHHTHSGYIDLPIRQLGVEEGHPYQAHDLLTGARYLWSGPRNFVELDPHSVPAHIFKIRRRLRAETDFDYFL